MDTCPARDVCRHPERQDLPVTTFKKAHDIYALGVILLEIGKSQFLYSYSYKLMVLKGLWRSAVTLEKHQITYAIDANGRPYGITRHLVKCAQTHFQGPMGQKYKDIVLKCLSRDSRVTVDTKEDLNSQHAFRTQIVEVLRKITESI